MKTTRAARSDKAWNVVFILVGYCIKRAKLTIKIICEKYFYFSAFQNAGSAGWPSVTRKAKNVIFVDNFSTRRFL